MGMTISEALRRIRRVKGRLGEDLQRAAESNIYMNENKPAFEFPQCIESAAGLRAELVNLQAAVASANATNQIRWKDGERSLAWCVAQLREIKSEIEWLKHGIKTMPEERCIRVVETKPGSYGTPATTENRQVFCTLTTAKAADRVRQLEDDFTELNGLVEAANHQVRC